MPQQFFYKAMDAHGRISQGQIVANNVNDLEARLERMGLDLIHYRAKTSYALYNRVGKVTRQELITFCFHMEQLTHAGVPLVQGLEDLRDSLSQSRFREVTSSLIESIQGGESLSQAMEHFPEIFNQVFVSLIHAGEQSGRLNDVFAHLTESLKWQDELVAKTKKLLMYPSFMALIILGVLFFLMMYLVPQLLLFFKAMDADLPLHTKVLIATSDFFLHFWYLIIGFPIFLFFLIRLMISVSASFALFIDRLKLKLWIVGPIMEKIILARFANFFALLYASGITVLESLRISQKMAGNRAIELALQQVTEQIADGTGITESFRRVRLFPPLVLRMVKVGEATGELDKALMNVSYFYNREVQEGIDRIQTMIEPAMTVIMGLLLGWIMLSVLGPVYDLITQFKF